MSIIPLDTYLAMAIFAFAASASPGPVNIIGAMTGARFGARRALTFVTGATVSFLVLLVGFGTGMLAGGNWLQILTKPMTLIGGGYLLWLALSLARDSGHLEQRDLRKAPGFWSGALVQGLNPKAWLAVISSLSTFVMPLNDAGTRLGVFAVLYGIICWFSLALWAWGGAKISQGHLRIFNRCMAMALALSVIWMITEALL